MNVTVLRRLQKAAARAQVLERETRELRAVLGEFLDDAEEMALGNYPLADVRGPARLNKILGDEMLFGDNIERADLRRIKRARKALGLPHWWTLP